MYFTVKTWKEVTEFYHNIVSVLHLLRHNFSSVKLLGSIRKYTFCSCSLFAGKDKTKSCIFLPREVNSTLVLVDCEQSGAGCISQGESHWACDSEGFYAKAWAMMWPPQAKPPTKAPVGVWYFKSCWYHLELFFCAPQPFTQINGIYDLIFYDKGQWDVGQRKWN